MNDKNTYTTQVGAVVIGRNEGQRLIACLESLTKHVEYIVYVDSGSCDGSMTNANDIGVESILLDLSIPFTAARARNEGAIYLLKKYPELKYIQFIDGDCEIQTDWISTAIEFLNINGDYAIACGRRRERFPENSIYNQLCDIEWNTPLGDASACGGDALIRVQAFKEVNGYRDDLIAGEEPEMCFRLRKQGWKIRRLNAEMTLHDAAMVKVSQWWNRAKRSGYAYAHGYYLHGNSSERFKFKELKSIILWALLLPIMIIISILITLFSLIFIFLYPAQIIKNVLKLTLLKKMSPWLATIHSTSNLLAKFPQLVGGITFVLDRVTGKKGQLIEYK